MKKLLGVGLALLVVVGSLLASRWLTSTPAQLTSELPIIATSHFLPEPAKTSPLNTVKGEPVLALQAGRVWEIYFHEGQRVRKGQLLLKLVEKLPSVAQQQLQARLQKQQQALDALLATQPAPTASALTAAREQIAATRTQLARAVPMLSFLYVSAPADGLITGRLVATGDYLTPQMEVARLSSELPEDTTLLLSSVE
ncbi:efflux RND transporter periplasmic adaptor subunit [Hymenobacter tenuis]